MGAIIGNHYGGNHRNMTYEEEEAFLAQFIHEADGGHITDVSAIKSAYDKKIGHETGHRQIYYVLHRHGRSKKLPRSKHPKGATLEAIVLACDGAVWHKSGALKPFSNIEIMFIPPYTPEMNLIEQIWKELRARGFHNKVFLTLEKVVDRLHDTICSLSADTIRSITGRNWIVGCFN